MREGLGQGKAQAHGRTEHLQMLVSISKGMSGRYTHYTPLSSLLHTVLTCIQCFLILLINEGINCCWISLLSMYINKSRQNIKEILSNLIHIFFCINKRQWKNCLCLGLNIIKRRHTASSFSPYQSFFIIINLFINTEKLPFLSTSTQTMADFMQTGSLTLKATLTE